MINKELKKKIDEQIDFLTMEIIDIKWEIYENCKGILNRWEKDNFKTIDNWADYIEYITDKLDI